MKNYSDFVKTLVKNFQDANNLPLRTHESIFETLNINDNGSLKGKNILIFAPHPDDECIIGLLPLRLMAEAGANIIDVAVTLGSKLERRQPRRNELADALKYLNWDLRVCAKEGFDNIRLSTKHNDLQYWNTCVEEIVTILKEYNPHAIFVPHIDDWNATHIGTSYLISDAVEKAQYQGIVFNTEYWGGIKQANLMVEASEDYIACLMQALARHVKEVERNDYHLRLPSWMCDNVRRGAELVGGQGESAPKFNFATLYNALKRDENGVWKPMFKGKFMSLQENVSSIF
ncbi:MAG: PIG-L family deacetylase [Opitutales bacterium]|nr:PIG-L family deacetylase [Opitutales bacterium]